VDHIRSIHLYRETGIVEMALAGRVVIIAEIIEGMKKSGYVYQRFYNSVDPEFIDSDSLGDFLSDIKDEDDVLATYVLLCYSKIQSLLLKIVGKVTYKH
jgi:hypothetical protein